MDLISFGLIMVAFIITTGANLYINYEYSIYKNQSNNKQVSGRAAAKMILAANGLNSVSIECVDGTLTDHYDSAAKAVRLCQNNYNDSSIAAVAVACHECGHALQDKDGYLMLRIRHALFPIVRISSYMGYFAIAIGVCLSFFGLIWLGILSECIILLFQIVTLPVEFNASFRALKKIEELDILDASEHKAAKKVLIAAALTYVASVSATLLEILRLLLIFGSFE